MSWLPFKIAPESSQTPVAQRIRILQALDLVRQMPLTIAGNLLLSGLSVFVLRDLLQPAYMLGWLALFWLAAIPGTYLWWKFRRAKEPASVSARHIRRAAIFSFVVALPWAVGNWFLFDRGTNEDTLFLVFVAGGLTAGTVSIFAAIPSVSLVFVTVTIAPLILQFLLEGDLQNMVMGCMIIIYAGLLGLFVRNAHRSLIHGAEMEIDRRNIIRQLEESHQRLSRTLESASDEILLFDSEERLVMGNSRQGGSLLFANDALIPGAGLADLTRSVIPTGLIPEAAGNQEAWLQQFLAWYRAPDAGFIVKTKDALSYSLSVQPTIDDEMFLVITDISALSMQAAMARQSKQRLEDFAETAADWMWEVDSNYKFTLLRSQRDASGPLTSMLGEQISDVTSLMPIKEERKALTDVIAGQRRFRDQRIQFQHAGHSLTLSISGKPILDENGKYQGHRGTFRDVTQDVLAAKQLLEAKEQAEIASRAKSEFLAHMSHELRTPLNAILGFSEIMSMGIYGEIAQEKYREYVDTIHESGAHLLAIINDILDISRIESGKAELHEQKIDVIALFESCLKLIEGRASAAGHIVRAELPRDLPNLWADERNIKQIVINLLGNAIKFTPPGGHIKLGAEITAQGCMRIFVQDNGPGISKEDQARVLLSFDRGSALTRREAEGSGLGLPLSRLLTELHGGRLSIDSETGKGTKIIVEMPQARTMQDRLSASG